MSRRIGFIESVESSHFVAKLTKDKGEESVFFPIILIPTDKRHLLKPGIPLSVSGEGEKLVFEFHENIVC